MTQLGDRTEVTNAVFDVLAGFFGVEREKLTRDTHLVKDLEMTESMESVELVIEFANQLDVDIPDAVAPKLLTAGQLIDYIVKQKCPE